MATTPRSFNKSELSFITDLTKNVELVNPLPSTIRPGPLPNTGDLPNLSYLNLTPSKLAEEINHRLVILNAVVLDNMVLRSRSNLQVVAPHVTGELSPRSLENITTCINYFLADNQIVQMELSKTASAIETASAKEIANSRSINETPAFSSDFRATSTHNGSASNSIIASLQAHVRAKDLLAGNTLVADATTRSTQFVEATATPTIITGGSRLLPSWQQPRPQIPNPISRKGSSTLKPTVGSFFGNKGELQAHQKRLAASRMRQQNNQDPRDNSPNQRLASVIPVPLAHPGNFTPKFSMNHCRTEPPVLFTPIEFQVEDLVPKPRQSAFRRLQNSEKTWEQTIQDENGSSSARNFCVINDPALSTINSPIGDQPNLPPNTAAHPNQFTFNQAPPIGYPMPPPSLPPPSYPPAVYPNLVSLAPFSPQAVPSPTPSIPVVPDYFQSFPGQYTNQLSHMPVQCPPISYAWQGAVCTNPTAPPAKTSIPGPAPPVNYQHRSPNPPKNHKFVYVTPPPAAAPPKNSGNPRERDIISPPPPPSPSRKVASTPAKSDDLGVRVKSIDADVAKSPTNPALRKESLPISDEPLPVPQKSDLPGDISRKRKANDESPVAAKTKPEAKGIKMPHTNHLMAMRRRNQQQDYQRCSTLSKRVSATQLLERRSKSPTPLHADGMFSLPPRIPPPVMPLSMRKKVKY